MNRPDRPIRVVFADDHPLTRDGIRAALEQAPDITIVGEAADGLEAQRMVADLHPDVLLLDLVMPGLPPAEIERWVRNHCSQTTVLILTAHDRDCFLAQAVEAGVAGYLVKTERVQRIVEAIRCAARGEALITGGQLARAMRWQQEVGARWERLTEREREVLRLMAQGLDNQAIAQALHITPKTVECHVTRILDKLGVRSRQEAIVWAHTHLTELLRSSDGSEKSLT